MKKKKKRERETKDLVGRILKVGCGSRWVPQVLTNEVHSHEQSNMSHRRSISHEIKVHRRV